MPSPLLKGDVSTLRGEARAAGFSGVSIACEPTGHRWRAVEQLAADNGMPLVCVSSMLVAHAREQEDLAAAKNDERDATLIARLAVERRCYLPEPVDAAWERLRQWGRRRAGLVGESISCQQVLRDLLERAWPAVLDAAKQPFGAITFAAALAVVLQRVDHGDLAGLRRVGRQRFHAAVRQEMPRWGGSRPRRVIVDAVFDALTDQHGVHALRPSALERAELVLDDWRDVRRRITDVEARMLAVLEELNLTALLATIPGLGLVGAATVLAETGDLTRFHSGKAVAKHAGLAPIERSSGGYQGRTRLTGRGQPALRLAAWRVIWGSLHANPVWRARFDHLTGREHNPLAAPQARAALAAAMLRQLHAVLTRRVAWSPTIAAGGHAAHPAAA